jgi:hypothetical protein
MQYKLIDILKNDTKNKILYMILLVILCLFIIVQFYELTKFVYNYSYFFDYGKSLKDICLSSYAEYETSRFQVAMNLDNIKVQSDNFSKNSIYDVIILIMALCISLFSSFVLVFILLQGTNTEFISLLKEILNGTSFIENTYKVLQFSLMFILTLYVVFIPSIYLILKLSDTADISPFQVEAVQMSLHLIAILAIAMILIFWHIKYYQDETHSPSLFTKLMMILIFCLYSYVFIRITDNYSRDKHNNDLKYYDEVDSVISDYLKNIVGLSDITSAPLYTQKNTIFIIGNIIIGLVFIWLGYKYIIIRYLGIHKILPNVFKDEDSDILYYMIIPLIVILVIIFVCTANQEYNTNINKYVLYQPTKIYKQHMVNINNIFNQILENDKSSIENKSVCKNYANAIHLAIYSTIFTQEKAQVLPDVNGKIDITLQEAVKQLFIPKLAYIRTCDDSDYTNYNDIPEYSLDYYINNRTNIFFDDNKQCNTISNKFLISVMINCIPNPTNNKINIDNLNITKFKDDLIFAITNIQKGYIYDGTKDLEYSNNYENNNNISNLKATTSSDTIADKHLNTVVNSIVEIYKVYLLTMYTQTLTTINAICKCNGVEDITGVTEYDKITQKIIKEVTYNTNAYTSNLKREYITIFINKTKEFLVKVNAIMSSEIIANDKNYKLAKMIISNYNILHESAKFKHFPLYSESNQTDAENLTKDYFKDIEKIQEIIDKIHASILSKQSYDTVLYDKLVAEYQRYINIFAIVNTQSSDYFEQLLFSYKKVYINKYIELYNPKENTLSLSLDNGTYTTGFDTIKIGYIEKYTKVWKLSKDVFKNELKLSNTDYRADSTEVNTRANDASLSSYILIVIYLIGIGLGYIIA